jgi:hypothetical protein
MNRDAFTEEVSYTYQKGIAQSLKVTIESVEITVQVLTSPLNRRLFVSMLSVQASVTVPTSRVSSVRDSVETLAESPYLTTFNVSSVSDIGVNAIDQYTTTPRTSSIPYGSSGRGVSNAIASTHQQINITRFDQLSSVFDTLFVVTFFSSVVPITPMILLISTVSVGGILLGIGLLVVCIRDSPKYAENPTMKSMSFNMYAP